MMTFIQDFTRQIKVELKFFTSNKQINSLLVSAEQKIGFKREQIIYCNVNLLHFFLIIVSLFFRSGVFGILILYLIFGWNRDFVCNSIVFLIPTYAS